MKTTVMNEKLDWKHVSKCNLNLDTLLEKGGIGAEYPANRGGVFYKHLRKNFLLRLSREELKRINVESRRFKVVREENSYFSNHKKWIRKNEVSFSEPIPQKVVEEINKEVLKQHETLLYSEWPTYDESYLVLDEVEVVIQVNGKLRARLSVANNSSKEELENIALNNENVSKHLEGLTIRKIVVIPNKLVNIVAN